MDRIFRFRHLVIPAAVLLAGLLPAKARAAAPTIALSPAQPAGGYSVVSGSTYVIGITASDADAGDTVTLNSVGALLPVVTPITPLPISGVNSVNDQFIVDLTGVPSGTYTFTVSATDTMANVTTQAVTLVVDTAPTITVSQAGNVLTPPAGGFNFIAIPGQPLVLDVATSDTDVADTSLLGVGYTVNGGAFIAGVPPGAVQSPNTLGTDNSGPSGTDFLGASTSGGTFSSRLTFVPTAADLGSTFVLDYVADDGVAQTVVPITISVQNQVPTTVNVTVSPDSAVTPPTPGQPVTYTAVVTDQNGNPIAGAPVTFNVSGVPFTTAATGTTPISTDTVTVLTDANGVATFTFTPLFPGAISVTVTSGGVTTSAPLTTVIAISSPGAYVSGQGTIDGVPGSVPPVPGTFSLDLRSRNNGTFAGTFDFAVPGTPLGIFRIRTTTVTTVTVSAATSQAGRTATIFGTARVTGVGLLPVRIDAVDVSASGSPGDSLTITVFNPATGVSTIFGGNLKYNNRLRGKNDIQIRSGIPTK